MEHSERDTEGEKSDTPISQMGHKDPSTATKESKLELASGHIFGICKGCISPIKYPTIKLPIHCAETSEVANLRVAFYDIEYADYHVSCACKRLFFSGDVDVTIETEVTFKSKFKEWLGKKLINTVKTTVKFITPDLNRNNS
jgi:hypothetical protein